MKPWVPLSQSVQNLFSENRNWYRFLAQSVLCRWEELGARFHWKIFPRVSALKLIILTLLVSVSLFHLRVLIETESKTEQRWTKHCAPPSRILLLPRGWSLKVEVNVMNSPSDSNSWDIRGENAGALSTNKSFLFLRSKVCVCGEVVLEEEEYLYTRLQYFCLLGAKRPEKSGFLCLKEQK